MTYLGSKYSGGFVIHKIWARGESWSDLKTCWAIVSPQGQDTLKFRVQLGLQRRENWSTVRTLDWTDNYVKVTRAWQGRAALAKELDQLYGANYFVASCSTDNAPREMSFAEAVTTYSAEVFLYISYYVFTDKLDRKSDAKRANCIFEEFVKKNAIRRYVFAVSYVRKDHMAKIKKDLEKIWNGETSLIQNVSSDDLYKDGILFDTIISNNILGNGQVPSDLYNSFEHLYDDSMDQLPVDASQYLQRKYGREFVVVIAPKPWTTSATYLMNAHPKDQPELRFFCTWNKGQFGDDFPKAPSWFPKRDLDSGVRRRPRRTPRLRRRANPGIQADTRWHACA